MSRRTLAEAAADILTASRSAGGAMPPAKLDGEVQDLGGSTNEKPDGGPVSTGKAAGNFAKKNSDAQTAKTPIGAQAAETLPAQPQNSVSALVEPPMMEDETADGEVVEGEPELTAEEIAAAAKARTDMIREKIQAVSVEEDVAAMFAGQELSEEFKNKAKTIFEAAVVARAVKVVEDLEVDILKAAEESVEEIKEELEGNVDSYLNFMVEEWMKNNKVAVESNLRTEIVEEFIGGLRNLFVEHNFNVPEEEVSVVEALTAQVQELQGKINETLNTNIELNKKVNEARKVELLTKVCEGLTATQIEKIKTLAEGVEFTTEGEYSGKLSIIREQYFAKTTKTTVVTNPVALGESAETQVEQTEVPANMRAYMAAIDRTIVK